MPNESQLPATPCWEFVFYFERSEKYPEPACDEPAESVEG